jgi:hypothetical protein
MRVLNIRRSIAADINNRIRNRQEHSGVFEEHSLRATDTVYRGVMPAYNLMRRGLRKDIGRVDL